MTGWGWSGLRGLKRWKLKGEPARFQLQRVQARFQLQRSEGFWGVMVQPAQEGGGGKDSDRKRVFSTQFSTATCLIASQQQSGWEMAKMVDGGGKDLAANAFVRFCNFSEKWIKRTQLIFCFLFFHFSISFSTTFLNWVFSLRSNKYENGARKT